MSSLSISEMANSVQQSVSDNLKTSPRLTAVYLVLLAGVCNLFTLAFFWGGLVLQAYMNYWLGHTVGSAVKGLF